MLSIGTVCVRACMCVCVFNSAVSVLLKPLGWCTKSYAAFLRIDLSPFGCWVCPISAQVLMRSQHHTAESKKGGVAFRAPPQWF